MAEVLLDTKFLNKVFKLVRPTTALVIKDNKGNIDWNGFNFIPKEGALRLNRKTDNKFGFLKKYIEKNLHSVGGEKYKVSHQRLKKSGLTEPIIKEIEQAIVRAATAQGSFPESALYGGKEAIEQRKAIEKSTREFGFVYFIRNDDIYKIGVTDNLLRRMKELKPDEILNSVRCGNYQKIEKKLHVHFKHKRIPQTEYFRLDIAGIEEVHSLMTKMARY